MTTESEFCGGRGRRYAIPTTTSICSCLSLFLDLGLRIRFRRRTRQMSRLTLLEIMELVSQNIGRERDSAHLSEKTRYKRSGLEQIVNFELSSRSFDEPLYAKTVSNCKRSLFGLTKTIHLPDCNASKPPKYRKCCELESSFPKSPSSTGRLEQIRRVASYPEHAASASHVSNCPSLFSAPRRLIDPKRL